jgi:hypothetical protein
LRTRQAEARGDGIDGGRSGDAEGVGVGVDDVNRDATVRAECAERVEEVAAKDAGLADVAGWVGRASASCGPDRLFDVQPGGRLGVLAGERLGEDQFGLGDRWLVALPPGGSLRLGARGQSGGSRARGARTGRRASTRMRHSAALMSVSAVGSAADSDIGRPFRVAGCRVSARALPPSAPEMDVGRGVWMWWPSWGRPPRVWRYALSRS